MPARVRDHSALISAGADADADKRRLDVGRCARCRSRILAPPSWARLPFQVSLGTARRRGTLRP
jgi:hypothetical protein